jgi:DNA-binding XRE family transcriptional regulator
MANNPKPGGLDRLRELVREDPAAAAVYRDAQRRDQLFASMRAARGRRGLDQVAVAQAMGTTQSAVSDLENGRVDPRLSTLQRYARSLGAAVLIDVLLEGSPDMSPATEPLTNA